MKAPFLLVSKSISHAKSSGLRDAQEKTPLREF
jgi:hypothetical protein